MSEPSPDRYIDMFLSWFWQDLVPEPTTGILAEDVMISWQGEGESRWFAGSGQGSFAAMDLFRCSSDPPTVIYQEYTRTATGTFPYTILGFELDNQVNFWITMTESPTIQYSRQGGNGCAGHSLAEDEADHIDHVEYWVTNLAAYPDTLLLEPGPPEDATGIWASRLGATVLTPGIHLDWVEMLAENVHFDVTIEPHIPLTPLSSWRE